MADKSERPSCVPQGNLPPPPPKVFFGRSALVERMVHLVECLTPIALTGTGGIGKSSVILTVLDDCRIKQRFGDNRSFIRCDGLTSSDTHFLQILSEATGAGIENPQDLSTLRPHLSSREMVIVLDNAEHILALPKANTRGIRMILDELSQFSNIRLVITSRISNTFPPHCEIIEIPTLSMEAGRETFYRTSGLGEQSDEINEILKELDFHPLSITLLATVCQQNKWNAKQLAIEWEGQQTGILQARNLGSLAATFERSLASQIFQELGPGAREVLEVVAFFPRGIKEDNTGGMFPTISDGSSMFDTFCDLSLTYRGDGFVTMLAPLRYYLRPKDPMASPLLLTAKEHYFRRLSIKLQPGEPGFDESQWIMSEDVNVEHLLDVFTSIDADSEDVWDACCCFMEHLYWNMPRNVVLEPKIEALPDAHPFKPDCLASLSWLLGGVGNWPGKKQMLVQCLGLWRERRNDYWVADTLVDLSDTNRALDLYEEGIQQVREALDIFGRLGETGNQTHCLTSLASLLSKDEQLGEAEEAASHAMDLLGDRDRLGLCQCHNVLGEIHQSKANRKKATHHFQESLRIAFTLGLASLLAQGHLSLATLYIEEDKLNEARACVQDARLYAGHMYLPGHVFLAKADVLNRQIDVKKAKAKALDVPAEFGSLAWGRMLIFHLFLQPQPYLVGLTLGLTQCVLRLVLNLRTI